jgi:hypothetical protein
MVTCNVKKRKKEAPELIENLTFWTVARMVDRRPRMRISRRNVTVLLFTCLIQRSDRSRINSLFLAIGYLGFLYKSANPLPVICPCAPPLFFLGAAFPSPPPAAAAQRAREVRPSEIHLFLVCILLLRLELILLGRSCSPVSLVQSGQ